MDVIDTQVGEPPAPAGATGWPDDPAWHATAADLTIAAMDAVGVGAAVLMPHHLDYAEAAVRRYPDRLAYVVRVDHATVAHADRLAELAKRPGLVAVRLIVTAPEDGPGLELLRDGRFEPLLRSARQLGLPVFVFISGALEEMHAIAGRHPDLRLIVDHLGVKQGPLMAPDSPPFARLPQLLELAAYPNVAVKFSGAPTLTESDYPFPDLWPHLRRVVDAFGPERLVWASDFVRCRPLRTYAELLDFLRYSDELTAAEKSLILAGNAKRLLEWEPRS